MTRARAPEGLRARKPPSMVIVSSVQYFAWLSVVAQIGGAEVESCESRGPRDMAHTLVI